MHNIILKSTKKTVKYINFVNPEIAGLSAAQSRDFGIGKFPGSRDLGIPGSLVGSSLRGLGRVLLVIKNK